MLSLLYLYLSCKLFEIIILWHIQGNNIFNIFGLGTTDYFIITKVHAPDVSVTLQQTSSPTDEMKKVLK